MNGIAALDIVILQVSAQHTPVIRQICQGSRWTA